MTHLKFQTAITASPERCIDLALTVDTHLEYPGSRERVVAGVRTGRMGLNDFVTWESRRFGLPVHMTSKITELDHPHRFVDEMQKGPFKSWRHVHLFEAVDGGTLMTDDVEYRVPFGVLGALVDRLFVHRYMTRLASDLTQHIQVTAESQPAKGGNGDGC